MESRAPPQFESPISHLLASNNVATDQEQKAARLFIEMLNNRLSEIDQEINALLKKRQEERAAINDVIRRHKAISHPVRALAPEILSEIFHHCQRGSIAEILPEVPDSFHPLKGPLLLTHVCSQWRTVAVSSSRLWTTLRMQYGFPLRSQSQLRSQLTLALLWISRSGIAPLEVCFHLSDIVDNVQLEQNQIYRALLGSLNRWRSIYIITFMPHDVLHVLEPYTKNLSTIKKYTLISPDVVSNGRRRAQTPYGVYLSPDSITWPASMETISFQAGFNYEGFSLPLRQLTTLDIYSELDSNFITIKQFFSVLTEGPNLLDLRVRCLGIDLEFPDPNSTDTGTFMEHSYPRLQTLHITVVNDGYIIDPLLLLGTFPALKNFAIGSTSRRRPWSHAALTSFLERTSGSIQELEVIGHGIGWTEVAQYFSDTPDASRVSITANGLGDYELNMASDILRHLEHLRLQGEIHVSSGAFAEFLRRRCGAHAEREEVALLQSLDIRCLGETTEFVDAVVFENLMEYSGKGTKIQIETDYVCLFPRANFLPRRFH
ncbi:hypothetical protein CVT25_003061 [Psilocybe cyanescens]|uniref:Uncharacterized protein n=1 Tax=Psilocybe cyanescens TaxID=93625 RepID=A0A409XKA6_PSICY|nr:hypothetical protein CVT25_003061 [Psilocybe cyanescens]